MPNDLRGPDLEVHLPGLRQVPDMLDRQATASRRCRDHLEDAYGGMDGGPGPLRNGATGIINYLAGTHNRIRSEVREYFEEVRVFVAGQAEQVQESVELYETTDIETAAMLDASLFLPQRRNEVEELGRSAVLDPGREMAVGMEPHNPTDTLKHLVDYRADMPFDPEWGDDYRFGMARSTIWEVTHVAAQLGLLPRAYDIAGELIVPLTGDWAGMKTCGDAHANLAEAARDLHGNVAWIEQRIDAVWQGNVADACWLHVRRLQQSLSQAPEILEGYASAYQEVVVRIKEWERKAGEVAGELIDWAIIAVASIKLGPVPVLGKLAAYVNWPPFPLSNLFNSLWTALLEITERILYLTDLIQLVIQAIWDFEARVQLGMLHGPRVGPSLPSVPAPSPGYA